MALEGIHRLIDAVGSGPAHFPPTLVYNEGWLLRLALDLCARRAPAGHPLGFQPGATWFSEALLPSPFRPRYRGDPRAEARTHADGVVGHVAVGGSARADAALRADATQLVVTEAKLYSPLAGGTRNAPGYDQAARNVACIAELLCRARRAPGRMASLAFFVVAPAAQLKDGAIARKLDKAAIGAAVRARAAAFGAELGGWLGDWFAPALDALRIEALSWESLIAGMAAHDPDACRSLQAFYARCLSYNGPGAGAGA